MTLAISSTQLRPGTCLPTQVALVNPVPCWHATIRKHRPTSKIACQVWRQTPHTRKAGAGEYGQVFNTCQKNDLVYYTHREYFIIVCLHTDTSGMCHRNTNGCLRHDIRQEHAERAAPVRTIRLSKSGLSPPAINSLAYRVTIARGNRSGRRTEAGH